MDTTRPNVAILRMIVALCVIALIFVGAATATTVEAEATTSTVAGTSSPGSPGGFRDVPEGSVHADAIRALSLAGITSGCSLDRFCPSVAVTREQVASLMVRAFGLPATAKNHFRDVDVRSTHGANVNALVEAGYARGCSADRYCPSGALSREQAATILANALDLQPTGATSFGDLTGGVHDRAILALADAGLVRGCTPDRYCGTESLTRAQFASLLYRSNVHAMGGAGELVRTAIGSPRPVGSLSVAGDRYVLAGGGRDIWDASDSFEFASRSVNGDLSLRVRVVSQAATHPWAKAGLMIRADDSPGAVNVALLQSGANGVTLQSRSTAGAATVHQQGPPTTPPTWLRLDRSGDEFSAYVSDDGMNWRLIGVVTVGLAAGAIAGLAVTSHSDGILSQSEFSDFRIDGSAAAPPPPGERPPSGDESVDAVTDGATRLLYSQSDIQRYASVMSGSGPYFARGDAGHGGVYSPDDGLRSLQLANAFLADPRASYWIQPNLPLSNEDPFPNGMTYARPMHAAWVFMTYPNHPQREALGREVRALLLHHATHPSHDYSNATNYPLNFPGYGASPIFHHAHWMTRLIKARDMLGRESFTASENATLDRWFYDYANWTANWIHKESAGKWLPGRLNRDYSRVGFARDASRRSYDGGPLIGSGGMAYNNRNAAVASTMSLAANYLAFNGYVAPTAGGPPYGRYTVDQLLDHSRLFVEETLRFSVWPQGFQGDFERGDRRYHSSATPQLGWLYSSNVLANLLEIAEYHAKRGDMSVWNYGTTEGYDGSAGVPVAGGFSQKNLHFFAWSMARYMNNGWQRTNDGAALTQPHFFHDVIPLATAHRFAPQDDLLRAAWQRQGQGFPAYPQSPQSQGPWPAFAGEGAKSIGLIEQGGASVLSR
jgi:regulation of enolase protein 1 (concanavalin A-like superfamily)